MTRTDLQNAGGLACALALSLLGAAARSSTEVRVEQIAPLPGTALELVTLQDGSRGVRDASGAVAGLRDYRRIASASLLADDVLLELCEPERLIAVTDQSKHGRRAGFRHRARAGIDSQNNLEQILGLHPDLLFVNRFGDPRYSEQLRIHGVTVFDLGEMHGIASLLPSIRAIGELIGAKERAEGLRARFLQRLRAVAADVPRSARPRAIYVSAYGKQLYGGGAGTSFHEILEYGGAIDVAAERYRGWPALDPEQVLAMDPELLVTRQGMASALCHTAGLERLRPCRGQGRIVELDAELADDPGLPILELAEDLRAKIHGAVKAR